MDAILRSDRVGWPMFGLRTKDFPAQDLKIATTTEDGTFAIKFEKRHAGMERLPIFSGQARCTLPNQPEPEDVSNLMQTSPEFMTTRLSEEEGIGQRANHFLCTVGHALGREYYLAISRPYPKQHPPLFQKRLKCWCREPDRPMPGQAIQ